jgi:hypothetical protein
MLSMAPRRCYESCRLLARADRNKVGEELVAGHVEDDVDHREMVAAGDRVATLPALDAAPTGADEEAEAVLSQLQILPPALHAPAKSDEVHRTGG